MRRIDRYEHSSPPSGEARVIREQGQRSQGPPERHRYDPLAETPLTMSAPDYEAFREHFDTFVGLLLGDWTDDEKRLAWLACVYGYNRGLSLGYHRGAARMLRHELAPTGLV